MPLPTGAACLAVQLGMVAWQGKAGSCPQLGHLLWPSPRSARRRLCAQEWDQRYQEAASSFVDRDEKLDALGKEIEQGLELIGVTAIEDKLQVRRVGGWSRVGEVGVGSRALPSPIKAERGSFPSSCCGCRAAHGCVPAPHHPPTLPGLGAGRRASCNSDPAGRLHPRVDDHRRQAGGKREREEVPSLVGWRLCSPVTPVRLPRSACWRLQPVHPALCRGCWCVTRHPCCALLPCRRRPSTLRCRVRW